MTKSKIALRPYLDMIVGYCDTLSNEELTEIIVGLAKEVSTSGRVAFLEKLESFLTDGKKVMTADTEWVDQILDDIEALKESMQERIRSIEDGSYWDEIDDWENAGYDDEEPDYVSDDDAGELESFFDDADSLFHL